MFRRGYGIVVVPQVTLLRARGLSGWHVPGGPARAAEHLPAEWATPLRGPGACRVSVVRSRRGPRLVPLSLRAVDRNPRFAGAHRGLCCGDAELDSEHCRAEAGINRLEGVGVSEAPRGTLFHHYKVDRDGVIQWVNLLIATGQNNLAMQRTIGQIARAYVRDGHFAEGALNRIEAGIRAYDPCLSCSTHAVGQMQMLVELRGPDGALLDEPAPRLKPFSTHASRCRSGLRESAARR